MGLLHSLTISWLDHRYLVRNHKFIQDTVDELPGIRGTVFVCQFHCLIYGNFGWDIVPVSQFIYAEAKDASINSRHSADIPALGMLGNESINVR